MRVICTHGEQLAVAKWKRLTNAVMELRVCLQKGEEDVKTWKIGQRRDSVSDKCADRHCVSDMSSADCTRVRRCMTSMIGDGTTFQQLMLTTVCLITSRAVPYHATPTCQSTYLSRVAFISKELTRWPYDTWICACNCVRFRHLRPSYFTSIRHTLYTRKCKKVPSLGVDYDTFRQQYDSTFLFRW